MFQSLMNGHAARAAMLAISMTATAGKDFLSASGRLDWADGDTSSREIVVSILEDSLNEVDEQFAVSIASPSGGVVLLNTKALVKISDDGDAATPPSPPPPPPPVVASGGGAADGLMLILLSLLATLRVAQRAAVGRVHTLSFRND